MTVTEFGDTINRLNRSLIELTAATVDCSARLDGLAVAINDLNVAVQTYNDMLPLFTPTGCFMYRILSWLIMSPLEAAYVMTTLPFAFEAEFGDGWE